MAKAPAYDALDKYSSDPADMGGAEEDESEPKLSSSLLVLADKIGLDSTKAQALKDFIMECQGDASSGDYDDSEG